MKPLTVQSLTLTLVALCLAAPAVRAAPVYATDFESAEGYSLGGLNGQQSWTADADTVVQNSQASSGQYAIQMTADGSYVDMWHTMAARAFTDPTGVNPLVTVSQDVRVSARDEAAWLVAAMDGTTRTNSVEFDYTGFILVNGNSTGYYWLTGTWRNLTVTMDFTAHTTDVYYAGVLIADDAAFEASAGFKSLLLASDDYVDVGSSMYSDHLSITAAPEPASLGLLAAGLLLCLRRRRRA